MEATLKLDRNYLIVSRREESYAEMNSEEHLSCPGTTQLKLCTKPMALVSAQDQLCLTALLYDHEGIENLRTRNDPIANFANSSLPG